MGPSIPGQRAQQGDPGTPPPYGVVSGSHGEISWREIVIPAVFTAAGVAFSWWVNHKRPDPADRPGPQSEQVGSLQSKSAVATVPTGTIVPFGGPEAKVPTGWLPCNGGFIGEAEYPELAAVVGDRYDPTGGRAIHVPDLRGQVLIGAGSSAGHSYAVGQKYGDLTATLKIEQLPSHSHFYKDYEYGRSYKADDSGRRTVLVPHGGVKMTAETTRAGADKPEGVPLMQPSVAVTYIIKT